MNLGIIAGEVSQRLALIDIDYGAKPQSNGDTMPEALREYLDSLETPVVFTPSGGVHIYARAPGHLDNDILDVVGTRVELQAQTKYCVAPPSVLGGTAYRWAKPLGDTEIATEQVLGELGALFTQQLLHQEEVLSLSSWCKGAGRRKKPVSKPKAENEREARGLERWDADPGFVRAFVEKVDIKTKVNEERGTSSKFCCVMHPEENPSASLFRTKNGQWAYADHHQRDGRPVYPLVDVYARVRHNVRRRLTRNQRAAWKLRMLWEMKLLDGVYVEHPRLPSDGLSHDGLKLLEGFVLLRALQWSYRPEWRERGNPTSFARSLGARWCGLPERRFDSARQELEEKGLLVHVGSLVKGKTKLFNLPAYADTEKED